MKKTMKSKHLLKMLMYFLVVNMLFVSDVLASTKSTTPMKPWRYADKTANYQITPTLEKVKVKYVDHKIQISGKAEGVQKVIAKYDNEKKTAKVQSGKFELNLKYTKEKNIKLYGVNNQNEKVTKNKIISSDKFVTAQPVCNKINRTKKGITFEVDTEPGSLLTIKYKGKLIKKQYVDSSFESVFIREKDIKGKKGKLDFTQKNSNKKRSKKSEYSIIKVGECFESNV